MLLLYSILIIALFTDFYKCRIYNRLILAGYFAGFCYCLCNQGLWYISLGDSLFTLAILYPLFVIGAFGGGDIKLFTVIALFFGLEGTLNIIISSVMAGAVLSILKIIFTLFQKKKISLAHLYIHFSLPILIGTILIHQGGVQWITF